MLFQHKFYVIFHERWLRIRLDALFSLTPVLKSCLMKRLLLLLCLALLMSYSRVEAQDEIGDLLGRINNLRASVGLTPYALNSALNAAAADQAQWIVNAGSVSHTRPDGSSPRQRALAFGYPTTDVSENIYGGGFATVNDAWTFWVNSDIHYRGMVNNRYREIGIGVGRSGWGAAFVLVFGNPGGPAPAPPPQTGSSNEAAPAAAAPEQPSFVVGLDSFGNIMHEVQPGDTIGDILITYGYSWDMLQSILQLNNIADVRNLEVGTILLVPPAAGTYTPTPGEPSAETTVAPAEVILIPTPFPEETLFTPVPSAPPPPRIATAVSVPESLLLPTETVTMTPSPTLMTQIAAVPTPADQAVTPSRGTSGGLPAWLMMGIGVQVLVLIGAGVEYMRRQKR
jgi:hypothetical protein